MPAAKLNIAPQTTTARLTEFGEEVRERGNGSGSFRVIHPRASMHLALGAPSRSGFVLGSEINGPSTTRCLQQFGVLREVSVASPQRHEGGPQVAHGPSGFLPFILADIDDVVIGGFGVRVGLIGLTLDRVWGFPDHGASLPGAAPPTSDEGARSWRGSAAGRETGNPTLRHNGGKPRPARLAGTDPQVHARAPPERNLESWVLPYPRHAALSTPNLPVPPRCRAGANQAIHNAVGSRCRATVTTVGANLASQLGYFPHGARQHPDPVAQ